jgi:hypothetical protein
MRSTNHILTALLTATLLVSVAGCSDGAPSAQSIPRIVAEGSRARDFKSLDELAAKANAVLIVKPTGNQDSVPLPKTHGGTPDSAPTPYVEMEVVEVVSGSVRGDVINIVSPGIDENTGKQALLTQGPYLVFVAPAMYAANDPVGGYVIVGGPAGVFAAGGTNDQFARMDPESTLLPAEVSLTGTPLPKVTKTEEQLLAEGP